MNDGQSCVDVLFADSVTILDLEGEIDIFTATEFKEALLRSIDGGARGIVVDATKVTFMDSTGLSVLMSAQSRLRPLGGRLAIACNQRVDRLLKVSGLHDSFALYPDRDEALHAASAPDAR
jgi:anti-sigma B factor antagonist